MTRAAYIVVGFSLGYFIGVPAILWLGGAGALVVVALAVLAWATRGR